MTNDLPKVGDPKPGVKDPSAEWPFYTQSELDASRSRFPEKFEQGERYLQVGGTWMHEDLVGPGWEKRVEARKRAKVMIGTPVAWANMKGDRIIGLTTEVNVAATWQLHGGQVKKLRLCED
jgi:hypothetical protein